VFADNARANFFRPGGDHLTLLNVYNEVRLNTYIYIYFYVRMCVIHSQNADIAF